MKTRNLVVACCLVGGLAGCANMSSGEQRTLSGAGIGAAAGALSLDACSPARDTVRRMLDARANGAREATNRCRCAGCDAAATVKLITERFVHPAPACRILNLSSGFDS